MLKKVTQKMVSFIMIFMLMFNLFSPTITFAEGEDENTVEERRDYEIKKEEEWDISENGDGSVKAKWTLEDRTLRIYGNGEMSYRESGYDDYQYGKYRRIIEKIIIENGITNIGNYAFCSCFKLRDITIPNSVTSIGDGAFIACSNLKNIEMPDSITSIGDRAFQLCMSLESIKIPNGVTYIGKIFYEYVNIKNIKIPDSVIEIDDYAFFDCYNLENIEVAENNQFFSDIDGVLYTKDKTKIIVYPARKTDTEYVINDGTTDIGQYAFSHCKNLERITIPTSVTKIEDYAFYYCNSLKNIINLDSVTTIDPNAIEYCDNLTGIANSTTSDDIENEIEWDISENGDGSIKAAWTLSNKTLRIYKSGNENGKMKDYDKPKDREYNNYIKFIENVVIEDGVTNIGKYAFYNCSSLKNVTIPNSVTSIGYFAFEGCKNLENITIPEGITNIKSYSFEDCSSLERITIPESVVNIGDRVFGGCKNLKEINVQENNQNYKSIDGVLYTKDETIIIAYPIGKTDTEYVISDGTTDIRDDAFYGCNNLENITIPESVTTIGETAFRDCINLKSMMIPNSVTEIGSYAFCDCRNLKNVTISNRVTHIEDHTFAGCSSLKSITIPNSVTRIDNVAFAVENFESLDYFGSLENIIIPDSVIDIADDAFLNVPYIICKANSPAHTYAEDNGILYFLSNITGLEEYNLGPYELKNIKPNTNVKDMLDKIKIDTNNVKVHNKKGQQLGNTETVGTGMKLVLNDNEEYELSITGDVDGDGLAKVEDMLEINRHRLVDQEGEILKGVYFEAGDVTEDGKVDQYDMLEINRYRLTGSWE